MTILEESHNAAYDPQIRALNALALAWAERHLSEQTTYVHYNPHYAFEEGYQTIPIFENLLYAYALLKNKMAESVTEGKRILKGILQFQNLSEPLTLGNFPIYMHEYPLCRDRQHGVHLLPVLYWILVQFRLVLGSDLERELQERVRALLGYCEKSHGEKPFPPSMTLKLAAALCGFGQVFGDAGMSQRGESCLQQELGAWKASAPPEWFSPLHLSDLLVAFQISDFLKIACGWEDFWKFLDETYHRQTATYAGPSFYEFQWKEAPQTTPYHFYLSYFSGVLPKRLLNPELPGIYACLVQPSLRRISSEEATVDLSGNCEGRPWKFHKDLSNAYSLISAQGNKLDTAWKGVLPLRLSWGTAAEVHTLVAQGGNYETLSFSVDKNCIMLDYALSSVFDTEDRERRREVILSVDRSAKMRLLVNGEASTTFQLGDWIDLLSDGMKVRLQFTLTQGEGQFIGHLMPGNRASQLALKHENRFNAYDTLIFLRTHRRSADCRIHVKIETCGF